MKRLMSTLVLSAVLAGAGCTTTGKKGGPESTAKRSSGSSDGATKGATVGALSGAALGGGLGLIVGSSSGHAGEGLAVGALAGGAAGAGIGAAVGDQRAKTASRKDSLADQENQIREQRRELDSVKDSLGDELSSRGKTNRSTIVSGTIPTSGTIRTGGDERFGASKATYGVMETYRGNPRAKPYRPGPGGIPASVLADRTASAPRSDRYSSQTASVPPRGRLVDTTVRTASRGVGAVEPVTQRSFAPAKNTLPPASSEKGTPELKGKSDLLGDEPDFAGLDEPPVRTVGAVKGGGLKDDVARPVSAKSGKIGGLPSSKEEGAGEKSGIDRASTAITKGAGDAAGSGTVVAKQLGKLPADTNASCIQAEKEAARATNATSDADRLFYLGRASRLCPTSDTYQVELGKVFEKIGKIQEAKNAFRKAADLNPQNDVARDELSILENSAQ